MYLFRAGRVPRHVCVPGLPHVRPDRGGQLHGLQRRHVSPVRGRHVPPHRLQHQPLRLNYLNIYFLSLDTLDRVVSPSVEKELSETMKINVS